MSQYEERSFRSYNDFFMRRIKPEMRPVSMEPTHLIAPCDSRLTVHEITENSRFHIKGTAYTLESLLRDKTLARTYDGGTLLLFRLTVDDYHRYCYVDSGQKSKNHWLPGVFHTVNPAAAAVYPIYKENTRCYSFIESENFGRILQMEVGALMVGKIVNTRKRRGSRAAVRKDALNSAALRLSLCCLGAAASSMPIFWQTAAPGLKRR